jgi:hypothetical protein
MYLFLYTLYWAKESFPCSIYIMVGYVVKGIYCSSIRLLIHKRWEQETCRCFEFVKLIGSKSGVGDAWSSFVFALVGTRSFASRDVCVCVCVCASARARAVWECRKRRCGKALVQTALFTAILGDFRRWFGKVNEVDSDDVMWNMICAVAQLTAPPTPNY